MVLARLSENRSLRSEGRRCVRGSGFDLQLVQIGFGDVLAAVCGSKSCREENRGKRKNGRSRKYLN